MNWGITILASLKIMDLLSFLGICANVTFKFKVVLEHVEGYHRYFFGVKVKTVKLIGGRRLFAARSGLNVRTYSN